LDTAYNGNLVITKPAASAQYINLIRAGVYPWSIGTVYNSSTFGIGGGQGTDSSFSPFFVIDIAGKVGIGTTAPTAQLQVVGDTRFQCRSGFWTVGDGRLCVESTLRGPSIIFTAIATCKAVAPGCRVCKHTDLQQACGAGISNPYGAAVGWYGDHGVDTAYGGNWDDEFGTWNNNGCADNNDGPAYEQARGLSYNYRCCY